MKKIVYIVLLTTLVMADLSTTTITTGGDGTPIVVDPYSEQKEE